MSFKHIPLPQRQPSFVNSVFSNFPFARLTIAMCRRRFIFYGFSNTYSPIGKCNNVIWQKIFEFNTKFPFKLYELKMCVQKSRFIFKRGVAFLREKGQETPTSPPFPSHRVPMFLKKEDNCYCHRIA